MAYGESQVNQAGRDLSVTHIYYSDGRTHVQAVSSGPLVTGHDPVTSPYRGLGAYGPDDAAFFYGRRDSVELVRQIVSRSAAGSQLSVVSGASGAGKSSLLQAGVIHRIRTDGLDGIPEAARWPCLVMTPTDDPFRELAQGIAQLRQDFSPDLAEQLARGPDVFASVARHLISRERSADDRTVTPADDGRRLLLVIDQFEQIFTLCTDQERRRRFISAIHAAVSTPMSPGRGAPVVAVLAVRADFEARCAEWAELSDAVQGRLLLTSMTTRQLEMAITEPPKRLGVTVDRDLVARLLSEVAESSRHAGASAAHPGAGVLPLMSHALNEAWRQRVLRPGPPDRPLTLEDYQQTGGLESAVAQSAEAVYGRLDRHQQRVARALFLRLARAAPEGGDTAAAAARADLAGVDDSAGQIIEAFVQARLIMVSDSTAEISHEALLLAWPTLRGWLDESRSQRLLLGRLRVVATEWAPREEKSYLYRGSQLAAAVQAANPRTSGPAVANLVGPSEREFIAASIRAEKRRRATRHAVRGGFVAFTVCLALVAVFALHSQNVSVKQRNAAIAARLVNESRTLADVDPLNARLHALAAQELAPSSASAQQAVRNAAAQRLLAMPATENAWISTVALSKDGRTAAFGGFRTDNRRSLVGVVDIGSGKTSLHHQDQEPRSLVIDSAGTVLADGKDGRLRDAVKGTVLKSVAEDGVVSAGGKWVLVRNADTVRLIDAGDGSARGTAVKAPGAIAVSDDGTKLAARQKDGSVAVVDVPSGKAELRIAAFGQQNSPVALSPDGRMAAVVRIDPSDESGKSEAVRLVDTADGRVLDTFTDTAAGKISCIVFSADGLRIAAGTMAPSGSGGGDGGHLAVWDLTPGRVTASTSVQMEDSFVEFSHDGRLLVGAGRTGAVLSEPMKHRTHSLDLDGVPFRRAAFSADATRVAVLAWGGEPYTQRVHIWDLDGLSTRRHRLIELPRGDRAEFNSIALSGDGLRLAVGGMLVPQGNGFLRVWSLGSRTPEPVGRTLTGAKGQATRVALSPDGRFAAMVTRPGAASSSALSFWDVSRQKAAGAPVDAHGEVSASAADPANARFAMADASGQIRIWSMRDGTEITAGPLRTGTDVTALGFGADGRTLAVGSNTGEGQFWDTASEARIGNPVAVAPDTVAALAFTTDGKQLAAATTDGRVRRVAAEFLLNAKSVLCRQVGSHMTRAWWSTHVTGGPGPSTAALVCR
ncbi:WD40 repeat domain-containing protein [Streptomyces sp. SM18]|nr:WD40 repeat domain-containing protein [Streptomyces sp. SM18]